jgi:uncharacterized protein
MKLKAAEPDLGYMAKMYEATARDYLQQLRACYEADTPEAKALDRAIARLSAVDDLLQSLSDVLPYAHSRAEDMHESGGDNDPLWQKADAAVTQALEIIAKAKGE